MKNLKELVQEESFKKLVQGIVIILILILLYCSLVLFCSLFYKKTVKLEREVEKWKEIAELGKQFEEAIEKIESMTVGTGGQLAKINRKISAGDVEGLEKEIEALPDTAYQLLEKEMISLHSIEMYKWSEVGHFYPLVDGYVSSEFGPGYVTWYSKELKKRVTTYRSVHDGTDMVHLKDGSVYASKSGVVVRVVFSNKGYGNFVVVKHNDTEMSSYCHLDKIYVKKGRVILRTLLKPSVRNAEEDTEDVLDTCLGLIGNTGNSTGTHLHYIFWKKIDGVWYKVNPYKNTTFKKKVYLGKYK